MTLSSTAQHTGRAIDSDDPHMRENYSAWGMSTDRGALSQLRAATDPDAPGGGFYGPLFATNGPPVRKPLVRPGSDGAIEAPWQVAERETGIAVDIGGAMERGSSH